MGLAQSAATELLALATGVLMVTSALFVWRRSLDAAVRLLVVQGVAMAGLVVTIALDEGEAQLLLVAGTVLSIKGAAIPAMVGRAVRATGADREDAPRLNPTAALVLVALLSTVAYLVSRPIIQGTADHAVGQAGPATFAVPVGITMVLIGLLLLATRRRALSQLVGFLVLDNGIATVAFLTAAGVPFVVELGVSFDVLLIALILALLSGRMHDLIGASGVDMMTELRD